MLTAAGAAVAEAIGSKSLIADAARGASLPSDWLRPVALFFALGVILGAVLYFGDRLWRPWWASADEGDLIADWKPSSLIGGVTYGGVTEEVPDALGP